nr:MAG TPA: hypothetical protein [Caudoviricetes sp.]
MSCSFTLSLNFINNRTQSNYAYFIYTFNFIVRGRNGFFNFFNLKINFLTISFYNFIHWSLLIKRSPNKIGASFPTIYLVVLLNFISKSGIILTKATKKLYNRIDR